MSKLLDKLMAENEPYDEAYIKTGAHQYKKLDRDDLERYLEMPMDARETLLWNAVGQPTAKIKITRMSDRLYIDQGLYNPHYVHFDKTTIGKTVRNWYVCSTCKLNQSLLYLTDYFRCHKCSNFPCATPSNTWLDNTREEISNMRRQLWPDMPDCLYDDVLESCGWWPKPEGADNNHFELERRAIVELEKSIGM